MKTRDESKFSPALWFAAVLCVAALGIYFRTYSLHGALFAPAESREVLAGRMVFRLMVDQIRKGVDAQYPQLSPEQRQKIAEQKAAEARDSERGQYEEAVRKTAANLQQSVNYYKKSSRRYLLEADPYFYYRKTYLLEETGRIAEESKDGSYFDPLINAPHGYWNSSNWHPYVGFFWYRLLRIFNPRVEMMEALGYVPLALMLLVVAVFFWLARLMGSGVFPAFTGALILVLSPVFIQRSAYGWYDTDPYNYIFPLACLALFFRGTRDQKGTRAAAAAAGFLTGLYALFWVGWPILFGLMCGFAVAGFAAVRLFPRFPDRDLPRRSLVFLAWYVPSAVISAVAFITPAGFVFTIKLGWTFLAKFSLLEASLWPNVFMTVGEAQRISVKKLIYLTGNYLSVGLALIGLVSAGVHGWRQKKTDDFFRWTCLLVFAVPLFVMTLQTERFSVFLVMPLALAAMLGAERLNEFSRSAFSRAFSRSWQRRVVRSAVLTGLSLLAFPVTFIMAHIVALGIHPIMDDTWYAALTALREKTPEDAIVDTWWPPGHFITSVARRGVLADGGTQHLRTTYWMSRAFLSADEKQAAGFLRMLNVGGEKAQEYLQSLRLDLPDAIDLIGEVVPLSRAEAQKKLPASMGPYAKEYFLNLTHGARPVPPSYVFIYDDLITQNLAVSTMATWNFRKAKSMSLQKKSRGRSPGYIQDSLAISEGVLKYMPEAALERRDGNILFFKNGLIVNLDLKEALVSVPDKGVGGRPASFLYMENGQLVEKKATEQVLDVSALLIRNGDTYSSVMADARLLQSLLYRLYYLRGEGLRFFKPFFDQTDPQTGTTIRIFELDWAAFEAATAGPA